MCTRASTPAASGRAARTSRAARDCQPPITSHPEGPILTGQRLLPRGASCPLEHPAAKHQEYRTEPNAADCACETSPQSVAGCDCDDRPMLCPSAGHHTPARFTGYQTTVCADARAKARKEMRTWKSSCDADKSMCPSIWNRKIAMAYGFAFSPNRVVCTSEVKRRHVPHPRPVDLAAVRSRHIPGAASMPKPSPGAPAEAMSSRRCA